MKKSHLTKNDRRPLRAVSGPPRRSAPDNQKLSEAHPTTKNSTGQQKISRHEAGAGRRRIVFGTPAPDKNKNTGQKNISAHRRRTAHRTKQKNLRTDTGRAAETEFIENHWKTNGFHCFWAKMIEIQMVFQRFLEEPVENHRKSNGFPMIF